MEMSSHRLQQDSTSPENMQPGAAWQPFPDLEGVQGGLPLRADGPMSWNGFPADEIVQNRLRFFKKEELEPRRAVGAEQVHGITIYRAGRADAGRGMLERDMRIPATDGLITNDEDIILTTLHADCAPV